MTFDLIAQANNINAAQGIGMLVGIVIAVLLSASIPISVGTNKGQAALGWIGGIISGGMAVLLGCLGGLPRALFFVIIILVVSSNQSNSRRRRKRRREYDDEDEYDDEEDDDYDRRRRRDYR